MKRRWALSFLLVATIGASAAAPSAVSAASSAAGAHLAPPAELVALEQKMRESPVNSVRFSYLSCDRSQGGGGFVIIAVPSADAQRCATGQLSTRDRASGASGTREVGEVSSLAYEVRAIEPAAARSEERFVGDHQYEKIARGGGYAKVAKRLGLPKTKPWLRAGAKLSRSAAEGFARQYGFDVTGSNGLFAETLERLGEAQAVVQVGPATVAGQQTIEFAAKAKIGLLLGFGPLLRKTSKLLSGPYTKLATFDVYISPEGLPLRTVLVYRIEHETIEQIVDLTANDVPVTVHAPPADRTISFARLVQLLHRRALRERARSRDRRKRDREHGESK